MNAILEEITDVAVENFLDMVNSKYGSFVARRLVHVLAGEIYDPKKARRKNDSDPMSRSYVHSVKLNLASKVVGQSTGHPAVEPRGDLLEKVCRVFLSDDLGPKDIKDLQCSTFAGPFLKALMEVVGRVGDENIRNSVIIALLGGNPAVGPDSITPDTLYHLMTDKSGSHLVEAALVAAPDTLFNKLCTSGFKGRMAALAQHPAANFAVQAGIAHAKKSQQLKRMFEDLRDDFGTLLRGRRGGVVTVLLAAAARLNCLQGDIAQSLWKCMEEAFRGDQHKSPLHTWLTLDTTVILGADRGRLSPLGCSALVTILQFPKGMAKSWNQALENLTAGEIRAVALDSGGCRVLEAYLTHEDTSLKRKTAMLQNIHGTWADIALSGAGSRFVESCYGLAEAADKKHIAQELSTAETKIAGTYRGPILLQKCRVDEMRKGSDVWESKVKVVEETKKEFEEIFGSNAKANDALIDDADEEKKIEKKKKKKKEAKEKKEKRKSKSNTDSKAKKQKKSDKS